MPRPRHITPRELLERSDGRVYVAGRPGAFLPRALFASAVDLFNAANAVDADKPTPIDLARFLKGLPVTHAAAPTFSLGATMLLPGFVAPPSIEDLLAKMDRIPRTDPSERVFQLSQHIVAWIGSDKRTDAITTALGHVSIEILCQEGLWREFAVEIDGVLVPLFASETQFYATMLATRARCTDKGRISSSRNAAQFWLQLYYRGHQVPVFPSSLECLSRRKDRFQLYGDFVAQFNRAPSPGEIKLLAAKPKKEPPTKVEAVLATPATEVTKAPAVAPTVNAKDLLVAHLGHMWAYIAKITAGDTTAEVMFESALQLVGKAELDPIPPAANSKLSDYVHPEGAPPPFSFRDDPKAYELVLGISALARDVVEEIGKQMPPRASWGLVDLENGDYEIRVPLSENETEEHAQRSNAHTWAVKLSLIMRVPAPDRVRETAVCFPR